MGFELGNERNGKLFGIRITSLVAMFVQKIMAVHSFYPVHRLQVSQLNLHIDVLTVELTVLEDYFLGRLALRD